MSEIRVWVDGHLVDADAPAIRAVDHGVTVGDGCFETAKVLDGEVFAMSRHLRRMDRSLRGLGLPPADHDIIRAGAKAVLAAGEPISFGRLRWTVTGGAGPLGSDRSGSPLTYIVTAGPQPEPPPGGSVVTVPWTRNERAASAGLKTTSYADNVVALAYAKERGAVEALFANTRDELCEGTGSNVFVVVAMLDGFRKLRAHLVGPGIETVRTIQRQEAYAILDIEGDLLKIHVNLHLQFTP